MEGGGDSLTSRGLTGLSSAAWAAAFSRSALSRRRARAGKSGGLLAPYRWRSRAADYRPSRHGGAVEYPSRPRGAV